MRAASSACRVGGTSRMSPSSACIATSCSTKSGFPSAAWMMRSRVSSGRSRSNPTSAPLSSSDRACSVTSVAFGFGAVHVGRSSKRSGRAVQRTSKGTSWANEATYSMRSRNAGSAQWMSSKTAISGSELAIASSSRRTPQAISSGDTGVSVTPSAASRRIDCELAVGSSVERATEIAHLGHDLLQWPVRDPLAVREAAADRDAGSSAAKELACQARLPDARSSDDRRQLRTSCLDGRGQRALELRELVSAPDERRVDPACERRHVVAQPEQPIRVDRLLLPLERERLQRLGEHGVPHEALGERPDEDLAHRGGLLEAGGDVDGVAGGKRLARARDHLPRVDADAYLEPQARDRLAHLHRGPHRAQGIVLVHLREAEDGHGCVANELLDGSTVALETGAQLRVVASHDVAQDLRVGALTERGRADEVAEDDRHRLSDVSLGVGRERCAACPAEPEAVRVRLTAGRADHPGTLHLRCAGIKQAALDCRWISSGRGGTA